MMRCRPTQKRSMRLQPSCGFTLMEMLLVVMVMSMLALFAIPMIRDGRPAAVHAAATMLRSDLERAQIMALAHPDQRIGLKFDTDGGGWHLVDADKPSIVLQDEFSGQPISLRMGTGRGQVAHGVQLDPTGLEQDLLVFDALGGLEVPGPPTLLRLRNDDHTAAVQISASTGWITINP
ncbi:MAG: prepilin-type N-terminal cleavage/methylation domain-containing protein [Planctomycetota bacterium]|nr:prepilin-type N-terminal cleavage/methylation domain-containing protein [Planctomycetota bacterium]